MASSRALPACHSSVRPGAQGALGRHLPAIWGLEVPQDLARQACPGGFAAMKGVNIKEG